MCIVRKGPEDPLEKEMATHSSILAWRIPWTEEPGGLQPTGSQRVRHNWVTKPPPHISKQWCHSQQETAALQRELVSLRKLRKGRIPAIQQPSNCSHSPQWVPRELRVWKHRIPPTQLRCISKECFQWAQTLPFSHHKKALDSFTWDIWFSVTIIFWCPDYLSLVAKLLYNLVPTPTTLLPKSSSLRVT